MIFYGALRAPQDPLYGFATGPLDKARFYTHNIVAALQANSNVSNVERDRSRETDAGPSDPGYVDQWNLPMIGWDQIYATGNPLGSSTIAVLDTGLRGTVYSARFAPDGRNVFYSASWDGGPINVFATDLKIPGTRDVGIHASQLLAVSSTGQMAILQSLNSPFMSNHRGTLAQVPLTPL